MPPVVARAEALLQAQAALGRRVLITGALPHASQPSDAGVLSLDNHLKAVATQSGKAWALCNLGRPVGYQLLVLKDSPAWPAQPDWPALIRHLETQFQRIGRITASPQVSAHHMVMCFDLAPGHSQKQALQVLDAVMPRSASPDSPAPRR